MCSRIWIVAIAAALIAAVACQPLPRPFAPDKIAFDKGTLRELGRIDVIQVMPVRGVAGSSRRWLSERIAAGLGILELPATARQGNGRAYRLHGAVEMEVAVASQTDVHLSWWLTDADDRELGRFRQRLRLDSAAWQAGDPESLALLVDGVVEGTSRLGREIGWLPDDRKDLFIPPIEARDSALAEELRQALMLALKGAGLPLAASEDRAGFYVLGTLTRADKGADGQLIDIVWQVIRPNGEEIGNVRQANTVPREKVDESWPELAALIADGGAKGIEDLLRRTGVRNQQRASARVSGN